MHDMMKNFATTRAAGLLIILAICLTVWPVWAKESECTRLALPGIDGGIASLEFAAAPLVTMTPIPFRLELKKAGNTPFAGAKVRCDLTMPAMPMPENRPKVMETEPGIYTGEAIFTMAGAWQAAFSVENPAGGKEILLFEIEKVLLK